VDAYGGAIFNAGDLSVNNSTFYLNTITPNAAETGKGYGGAIYNQDTGPSGSIGLTMDTFSGNYAIFGGALMNDGNAYVYNTIMANNDANDCYAANGHEFLGNSHNLIQTEGNGSNENNDCISGSAFLTSDPQLNAPAMNGGLTKTMSFLYTSPAKDSGDSGNALLKDQRDVDRPFNGSYDLGAYEFNSAGASITNVTSTATNGKYSTGGTININITFDTTVYVTGTPELLLETGVVDTKATYTSGSGSDTLSFAYTVQAGNQSTDLDYVNVNSLTTSGTIKDDQETPANLTLPAPGSTGSLGFNKNIIIVLPTTVTFPSLGTNDGQVLESTETSNKGGTINATGTVFNLGDDAGNKQYRGILHFNTSTLPDSAMIISVTIKIKKSGQVGTDPVTTHGPLLVDIRKPYFGSGQLLAINDFQATASQSAIGFFANSPVNNWYSAIFSDGTNINKTGTTQFRLRFTLDDNNEKGADFIKFYSGNYATATARPQLIIQYYVP
jgi:hypothetical protein